ncbi:MAG: plasmid mobilization relaxosome protein MobC [Proteobacteria bacterium]|nr:plasmid mobilization relaxosome protein MobC [Pseudomonadota bacterium]
MTHGSEKRVRNRHLTVRLSPDERAAIDEAAERAGLMPGSYARNTLLGAPAPRQVRRPAVERRELARLLGELGKIGGNLNQLAKDKNSGVIVYEGEINAAYRAILEMRDAVLKSLGREP